MTVFVVFWTLMIFLSIGWYGFLLFYIGFKGGREIKLMTERLGKRDAPGTEPAQD